MVQLYCEECKRKINGIIEKDEKVCHCDQLNANNHGENRETNPFKQFSVESYIQWWTNKEDKLKWNKDYEDMTKKIKITQKR